MLRSQSLLVFALALGPAGSMALARPQQLDCLHRAGAPCPHGGYDVVSATIDDRLFVIGGFTGASVLATRRFDAYDPSADTWRSLADLPTPVTHAPAVVVGREIWVLGGFVGDHPGTITDAVWRYDIDQNVWSPGLPLPEPVAAGSAARLGTRVHYFGGLEADRDTGSPEHYAFDVADPALGWVRLADLPEPRNHLSGVAFQGFLWAIGGQQGHDTAPTDTGLVHVYDAAQDTWVVGPPLPFARSHAEGATFATQDQVVIVGGRTSELWLGGLNDVTSLAAGAAAWRALPPIPHPISGAAATAIQGELLVTAGNDTAPLEFVEVHRRPLAAPTPAEFRTNVGGDAFVGAADWCADLGSDSGARAVAPASVDVAGTHEDARYRAQRIGGNSVDPTVLRYRLAAPPGAVRVTLHFAELWQAPPGARVFDVFVQGLPEDPGLDVAALVGADHALTRTYDVLAPFGLVDITLDGIVGLPALAGIEFAALPPPHLARTCAGQVGAAGWSMTLELLGSASLGAGRAELLGLGAPVGTLGILLQSDGLQLQPAPFGALCVGPAVFRRGVALGGAAGFVVPLDLAAQGPNPPAIAAGSVWHFQCWYRDAAGFGFSDALTLAFTP